MSSPRLQLGLLAAGQLLVMTLWFSATAVLPQLVAAWHLGPGRAAWLTGAVQLGFVAGALGSAMGNLADRLPTRRLIATSATLGALLNAALLLSDGSTALLLRFGTGVCLAGVYPPGMKLAAGMASTRGRGLAIGVLVAALTLGSATPHAVAALSGGAAMDPRWVLGASSGMALLGAAIVTWLVRDGAEQAAPSPFDPRRLGTILRSRPVALANLGYLGHMWELYAMWAWWATALLAGGAGPREARWIAFGSVGVAGALGSVLGGRFSDRAGRTASTGGAMAASALCCLLSPWVFGASGPVLWAFGGVWGATIVADSAQFSAAVSELVEPEDVGTALTIQTAAGFALTLLPIWGLPWLAAQVGWRWSFLALAPGPVVGTMAMLALRRRPEAARLAGGLR